MNSISPTVSRNRCTAISGGTRVGISVPAFLFLLALAVFLAPMANARDLSFRVKIVSAESHQFQSPPLNPPNCNWKDISAYCYGSSPKTYVENTLVVQDPSGQIFKIACTAYNRWSHCTQLPVNQTFQARMKKDGLEIRYIGQHHKWQKQVYQILKD
jgi:hypothetical protein